jgi:hypothetical protein
MLIRRPSGCPTATVPANDVNRILAPERAAKTRLSLLRRTVHKSGCAAKSSNVVAVRHLRRHSLAHFTVTRRSHLRLRERGYEIRTEELSDKNTVYHLVARPEQQQLTLM